MELDKVKNQLGKLQAIVEEFEKARNSATGGDDNEDRASSAELYGQLITGVRDLNIAVEGPSKYLDSLRGAQFKRLVMYVAVKTGIIRCLVEAEGRSIDARKIASDCGVDKNLAVRTLRFLASILGIGVEVAPEVYASNELASLLNEPVQRAYLEFWLNVLSPAAGNFDKFVKEVGVAGLGKEPTPFNNHFGGTIWQVLEKDAAIKQVFDGLFATRAQTTDYNVWNVFPVESVLSGAADKVAMVDVGGGRGHDLAALIRRFPEAAKHRFVLQDLPSTLRSLPEGTIPSNIEKQPYDFFSGPQPVEDAASYFMHDIIHDHSDENAAIILSHTAKAMSSTSRLLIADWVLKDKNAQAGGLYNDWIMMMLTSGGMERSLKQWTELLEGAGLKIVQVWSPKEDGQSVIEAMLSK